jgi:hypothetical protein
MVSDFFRYAFSVPADLLQEAIYGVSPVKKLPDEDTGRTQAKPVTRIRIKENGPVVKLLPEHR